MPKRRAESSDNPEFKKTVQKKILTEERSEHGRRKAHIQHYPPSTKRMTSTSVSSNWTELSKSLGIPLQRRHGRSSARMTKLMGKRLEEDKKTSKKKPDIWFDDVPMECLNGGCTTEPSRGETSTPLITGQDKSVGRSVALDCEMVGTGSEGSYSMLARACVVNHHGHVLYDSFVAPMDKITDYRTPISGVSPADLHGAPIFSVVQKKISDLLKDRILVGHSVQNDLKALLLSHPKKDIRDTAKYRVFKTIAKTRYPSLKKLAKEILGIDVQSKEHDPVEDAQAAMKLYQLHRKNWEVSVRERLTRSEIQQRRREKKRRNKDLEIKTCTSLEPFNIMLTDDLA